MLQIIPTAFYFTVHVRLTCLNKDYLLNTRQIDNFKENKYHLNINTMTQPFMSK